LRKRVHVSVIKRAADLWDMFKYKNIFFELLPHLQSFAMADTLRVVCSWYCQR